MHFDHKHIKSADDCETCEWHIQASIKSSKFHKCWKPSSVLQYIEMTILLDFLPWLV